METALTDARNIAQAKEIQARYQGLDHLIFMFRFPDSSVALIPHLFRWDEFKNIPLKDNWKEIAQTYYSKPLNFKLALPEVL